MKKNPAKTARKTARNASAAKQSAPPARESVTATKLMDVPVSSADLRKAIAILGDATQSEATRSEAIQAIQAASFSLPDFDSVRSEYVAALRLAAKDPDPALRQRALSVLSRNNDSFAQKAILDGLKNGEKALLPAEKALQLLSYNPHAGAYTVARELFGSSADPAVKQEALRLMSSDPDSAKVIEKTLADKGETTEIRRMSAAALHTLNPKSLQNFANKALLDKTENHDLVATCLTAMHQFGDAKAISENKALRKRLKEMETDAPGKLKQLTKQFITKYGL